MISTFYYNEKKYDRPEEGINALVDLIRDTIVPTKCLGKGSYTKGVYAICACGLYDNSCHPFTLKDLPGMIKDVTSVDLRFPECKSAESFFASKHVGPMLLKRAFPDATLEKHATEGRKDKGEMYHGFALKKNNWMRKVQKAEFRYKCMVCEEPPDSDDSNDTGDGHSGSIDPEELQQLRDEKEELDEWNKQLEDEKEKNMQEIKNLAKEVERLKAANQVVRSMCQSKVNQNNDLKDRNNRLKGVQEENERLKQMLNKVDDITRENVQAQQDVCDELDMLADIIKRTCEVLGVNHDQFEMHEIDVPLKSAIVELQRDMPNATLEGLFYDAYKKHFYHDIAIDDDRYGLFIEFKMMANMVITQEDIKALDRRDPERLGDLWDRVRFYDNLEDGVEFPPAHFFEPISQEPSRKRPRN